MATDRSLVSEGGVEVETRQGVGRGIQLARNVHSHRLNGEADFLMPNRPLTILLSCLAPS